MNNKFEHLDRNLVIDEIKTSNKRTIPEFQEYFNQKYSTNEPYSVFYNIIKTENLWNYITKTKQHESLENLVQNEELRDILFRYSSYNIKVTDLSKIIEDEIGKRFTKYTLKRLIAYYNLDYIVEREIKLQTQEDKLTYKQKSLLITYCHNKKIDINNLSIKDLFHLYNTFQYEFLANKLFEIMNKNK